MITLNGTFSCGQVQILLWSNNSNSQGWWKYEKKANKQRKVIRCKCKETVANIIIIIAENHGNKMVFIRR